jgi:hypothetical protein
MCAHHILTELVRALLRGVGLLVALRRGLAYLLTHHHTPRIHASRVPNRPLTAPPGYRRGS